LYDIYCMGGSSLDLVLKTPRLPAKDEKLVVSLAEKTAGGLVANAACASARLGCKTGWCGTVGDDDFGTILLEGFKHFGVDCSLVEILPGQTSDFCVILLDASGERTILVVPTIHTALPLSPPRLAALSHSRIAYTLPRPVDWFSQFSAAVHSGGGLVAVDVEASSPVRGEVLQSAIKQSDIVFCSRDGLELASGTNQPRQGAAILKALGAPTVVVTLGKEGAFALDEEGEVHIAGHDVKVVDTTGAGDCFHAAFMAGILRAWHLEKSLRFANCAAAIAVQHLGARGGLPDFEQALAYMEAA
jgi:sugar/nucleoside kinase (ribokinase family)